MNYTCVNIYIYKMYLYITCMINEFIVYICILHFFNNVNKTIYAVHVRPGEPHVHWQVAF